MPIRNPWTVVSGATAALAIGASGIWIGGGGDDAGLRDAIQLRDAAPVAAVDGPDRSPDGYRVVPNPVIRASDASGSPDSSPSRPLATTQAQDDSPDDSPYQSPRSALASADSPDDSPYHAPQSVPSPTDSPDDSPYQAPQFAPSPTDSPDDSPYQAPRSAPSPTDSPDDSSVDSADWSD